MIKILCNDIINIYYGNFCFLFYNLSRREYPIAPLTSLYFIFNFTIIFGHGFIFKGCHGTSFPLLSFYDANHLNFSCIVFCTNALWYFQTCLFYYLFAISSVQFLYFYYLFQILLSLLSNSRKNIIFCLSTFHLLCFQLYKNCH